MQGTHKEKTDQLASFELPIPCFISSSANSSKMARWRSLISLKIKERKRESVRINPAVYC